MKKKRRYNIWLPYQAGLRRTLLALCLGLGSFHAGAQGMFKYRAALDTIRKDAFYEIDLPPGLVAKCRADFADLRILAPGKQFVPYVLKDPSTTADREKKYAALPGAVMVQKDSSNKHSYITLEYAEAYQVDWLAFVIHSPLYYRRGAKVSAEGTNPGEWASIDNIVLEPNKAFIKITNVKTRRLRIDVSNADNAPLVISEVACFQSARALLTYLQAGSGYQVLAGNAQAAAPEYDLKYFTDSVHGSPHELVPGPPQPIDSGDRLKEITGRDPHSGLLLWVSLLAVLFILIYFSIRMVKAIAQKDPHDRV